MKFQLYNNGKNDNIYKGIVSKEIKVNFCLRYIIILMFSEVSKSEKKPKWLYKFISAENLFVF